MVPFKYSVNIWLVTGLQHSSIPPAMHNQDLGTQYEPVGVIEIVPLDRMEVVFKENWLKKQIPHLAVGGKPPFVKKYVVTTTKKVAYDQLQKPTSDLHNVHYCMPVLLREEEGEGNNIYIAVLHFYLGQRVLEVTHSSIQCEYDETPWVLLKHRIVHPMPRLATMEGCLCDNPQTYEYHPSPDHLGYMEPVEGTIVWESLLDDVMHGK